MFNGKQRPINFDMTYWLKKKKEEKENMEFFVRWLNKK